MRRNCSRCVELIAIIAAYLAMTPGFAALRTEMTAGFAAVRTEMTTGITVMRTEMTTGFAAMRAEMISMEQRRERDFRITFGAIITTTLGLAYLIARSAHWL